MVKFGPFTRLYVAWHFARTGAFACPVNGCYFCTRLGIEMARDGWTWPRG